MKLRILALALLSGLMTAVSAQAVEYTCGSLKENGHILMDGPLFSILQTGSQMTLIDVRLYPRVKEAYYILQGTTLSPLKSVYSNYRSGMTVVFERTSVETAFSVRAYVTAQPSLSTTCAIKKSVY